MKYQARRRTTFMTVLKEVETINRHMNFGFLGIKLKTFGLLGGEKTHETVRSTKRPMGETTPTMAASEVQ